MARFCGSCSERRHICNSHCVHVFSTGTTMYIGHVFVHVCVHVHVHQCNTYSMG